jgi:hypothetical protein
MKEFGRFGGMQLAVATKIMEEMALPWSWTVKKNHAQQEKKSLEEASLSANEDQACLIIRNRVTSSQGPQDFWICTKGIAYCQSGIHQVEEQFEKLRIRSIDLDTKKKEWDRVGSSAKAKARSRWDTGWIGKSGQRPQESVVKETDWGRTTDWVEDRTCNLHYSKHIFVKYLARIFIVSGGLP